MNSLDHHEAWEMKPRKLSIEEIEHPEKVIEEFFEYAHLPQVRWYLWEGLKTMITGSYAHQKSRDRSSLIYFYEQIEKLIEVTHVIHERKKSSEI
jgi:hypothetical protein